MRGQSAAPTRGGRRAGGGRGWFCAESGGWSSGRPGRGGGGGGRVWGSFRALLPRSCYAQLLLGGVDLVLVADVGMTRCARRGVRSRKRRNGGGLGARNPGVLAGVLGHGGRFG